MQSDLGLIGQLPVELIAMAHSAFSMDSSELVFHESLTSSLFEHSQWILIGCFFGSLPLAVLLVVRRHREPLAGVHATLAALLFGLFASQYLSSPIISFRYLQPFPPLVLVAFCALQTGSSRRSVFPARSIQAVPSLAD